LELEVEKLAVIVSVAVGERIVGAISDSNGEAPRLGVAALRLLKEKRREWLVDSAAAEISPVSDNGGRKLRLVSGPDEFAVTKVGKDKLVVCVEEKLLDDFDREEDVVDEGAGAERLVDTVA